MTVRVYRDGRVSEELEDADAAMRSAQEMNRRNLLSRIDSALAADLTYLALASPSTPQVVAQVERLTRQVVVLLRLVGERLNDTAGT